jgi:hypothetical protein
MSTLAFGALVTVLVVTACAPDPNLHDASQARIRRPTADGGGDSEGDAHANTNLAALGPAQLGPLAVEPVADCVRVRVSATRPVTAELHIEVAGTTSRFPLGTGASLFDAAFRVTAAAAQPGVAFVAAVDGEGLPLSTPPFTFTAPPAARGFVITELLANPAGDETKQEWVEVANLTPHALSTEGLWIEDAAGEDVLPVTEVPSGARFLVVGASFDPHSPTDVHPAPEALVLRVAGRIGRDGLGQKGEVVRLRSHGREPSVESVYGGWIDTSRPVWSGRSVQRQPDNACDHPTAWSVSPQPPTPGW